MQSIYFEDLIRTYAKEDLKFFIMNKESNNELFHL